MFKQILVVAALVACTMALPEANPSPVASPAPRPVAAPHAAPNPAAYARPQPQYYYGGLGYGYGGLGYAAPVAYGGLYY